MSLELENNLLFLASIALTAGLILWRYNANSRRYKRKYGTDYEPYWGNTGGRLSLVWDKDVYELEKQEGYFNIMFSWRGFRDWWSFFVGELFSIFTFGCFLYVVKPLIYKVAHNFHSLGFILWLISAVGLVAVTMGIWGFFFANLSRRLNTVGIDGELFLYIYMAVLFVSFFVSETVFSILFFLSFFMVFLQERTNGDLD